MLDSQRLFSGKTSWDHISILYGHINTFFPTQGSLVAGAVALAESGEVNAGIEQLNSMDPETAAAFQPWWVAKAYLYAKLETDSAKKVADEAYQMAIGLSINQTNRDYLARLRQALAYKSTKE